MTHLLSIIIIIIIIIIISRGGWGWAGMLLNTRELTDFDKYESGGAC
jgi:hypothetical protein